MEQKKLGNFSVFMLLICGIMFADAIAANSNCGAPTITWWVILGILYMIPSGLIIGELSAILPGEGGIFVWISEGLGPKWAARTSWLFFVCGMFIPVSSFVMCADIIFGMIAPDTGLVPRLIVAIILLWVMIGASALPMSESAGITNLAGIFKLLLFVGSFVAGIVYIMKGNQMATALTTRTLMPTLDQGLVFLPVIVYCCTGMELASASAEETKDPAKNLPKLVVGVAALAIILNVIASVGTLMVVNAEELDLTTGTIDMFVKAFGSPVLYYIVGIIMIFTVFAQCMAWMIGGNRGTAESAKAGELPAILGKETKGGQPIGAMVITGIFGTAIILLYAVLSTSGEGLFYSILSCGVIGSLLPYVFMLIAYQRLKKERFKTHEGFTAPAGIALSWLCQIIQVVTLFLMIYIPTQGWNPDLVTNLIGTAIMVVGGEIAIKYADSKK